jgi:hypothetical protein
MAKLSRHPNFALGPGSSFFDNPRVRKALETGKEEEVGTEPKEPV